MYILTTMPWAKITALNPEAGCKSRKFSPDSQVPLQGYVAAVFRIHD